jgi:hypothetical protein
MSKSPVKKALDTTCSHFDTRFAGLRDALERWIDCEAFKGQLESLTTGRSAKTEEQHVAWQHRRLAPVDRPAVG